MSIRLRDVSIKGLEVETLKNMCTYTVRYLTKIMEEKKFMYEVIQNHLCISTRW